MQKKRSPFTTRKVYLIVVGAFVVVVPAAVLAGVIANKKFSETVYHFQPDPQIENIMNTARTITSERLKYGATQKEFDTFLSSQHWVSQYDPYNKRHSITIYRSADKTQTVVIYVYFDSKNTVIKTDVLTEITWL
jgi:hypothetical protein